MKNLFIGIDFSKNTFDASFFEKERREEVNYQQFKNTKEGYVCLVKWIKGITGIPASQWLFCGEHTGLYSVGIMEFLLKKKLFIWLENPLQIKLSSGIKREKNDKVDSGDIALYGFRFRDKAICCMPTDKDLCALGLLLSFRERLIRSKKSLLVAAAEMRAVFQRDPTARYIYEQSARDIDRLNKEIKETEKRMKEIIDSSEALKENYRYATSIKGIAMINTVAIIKPS